MKQGEMNIDLFLSESFFNSDNYLKKAKAMEILGFSRHTFDKCVKKGIFEATIVGKTTYFLRSYIEEYMKTEEYRLINKGTIDPRNPLNDLTGKAWLPETKSYFFQKGLGADHPDAQIEKLHPAPYSFQDIEKMLLFFTKKGMTVLDPFGGVGSTAKACEISGRHCISIELSRKYHDLSIMRLEKEVGKGTSKKHKFINGDTCEVLPTLETNSVDMIVTSPPYWGILNKQDQKVKKNRVANNLDTKYSDSDKDLGNIGNYNEFIEILINSVFLQSARILRPKKYMLIVVSDFRDKGDFISFHSDLIQRLNNVAIPCGGTLGLAGTKILIQNHKSLHPYGYPFSYVENIHHQYVLIFRKK